MSTEDSTTKGYTPYTPVFSVEPPGDASSLSASSLSAIIYSLGQLRQVGYSGDECKVAYDTDKKSLDCVEAHCENSYFLLSGGLESIGHLLWIAANNDNVRLESRHLANLGLLITELAGALVSLNFMESTLSQSIGIKQSPPQTD